MNSADQSRRSERPLISVVVCTRNRAGLLDQAMASVVRQDFPKADYEIVVVDNGSTDPTSEIAQGFQRYATVRYVREERIGLCVARNTGWQAAAGKYVALFDDDAVAQPGWLLAIRDAFLRSPDSIGVIGGRVDPIWQGVRPPWLSDDIAGSLTIVDWGSTEKVIKDIRREWLVGANMAAPKAILTLVGGFHPWLDRVGDNLLSSGDVFFQKEVMRLGYQCLYVPEIAIQHLVPPSRLTQEWFKKRFFWQGVSDAVMHLIEQRPSPPERLRLALARAGNTLWSRRRIGALLAPTSDPETFKTKCFALIDMGFAAGLLGAARR